MYRILIFLFIFSHQTFAEDESPLDPAYEGIHGMVIVNKGSNLYAYNLASYKTPHNVQLLYKLEIRDFSLIQLVRDADLVTLKTQPFNLERLIRGEKVTVAADIYLGHFARGGMQVFEKSSVTFNKQLYVRKLDELESKDRIQRYDAVEVGNDEMILVHQIQTSPSFDHLVLITDYVSCIKEFSTEILVPKENTLNRKLINCGPMKPLYYETESFKAESNK